MGATDREFQAQSGFIAACDDPNTLLDWMREYRDGERAAVGRGDEEEARQMEDLVELAEDRIVEIKASRLTAAAPRRRVAEAQPAAPARPPVQIDDSAELRKEELAASREAQARTEREKALAERERVAAVERAEQRARDAVAAPVAVERAPATIVAPVVAQNRSPEREAHRERVREIERLRVSAARAQSANKQPPTAQQPAAIPPAPAQRPVAPTPPPIAPAAPTAERPAPAAQRPAAIPTRATPTQRPAPIGELTPLARLFQQRLTETTPVSPPARPEPVRTTATRPPPLAPPAPGAPAPVDPVDDLPQHTGADLAAYRAWLGVDQRALAARFGVGQGTISKGESKPGTVLGPALRRALHEAMGEPRPDVGGAR